MRFGIGLAAAAMLMAGAAFAQGDVIAERKAGLKRMGEHAEALKVIADRGGDPRAAVPRIDDMLAWFQTMPTRFPPGSDRGDTKARPEIWSDRPGFERANENALRLIGDLRTVAANGDAAGFATQFNGLGAQACGGCHRPYRAR